MGNSGLLYNILFLLLTLLAEVIGTVGGYGSSVYFVPIGNFFFDFHTVLGLTAVFHVASNLSKVFLFKKGLNKKLLLHLGIPAVIFVVVGGLLSKYISDTYLEIILGVFLVLMSSLFLVKKNIVLAPNKKNSLIGGTLSGLSAGILGTGGAIRGLTMSAFNLEKDLFIATSAIIDLLVDASRAVVYLINGYIGATALYFLPFLVAIGWIGTYLGKRILQRIPQEKFRRFSLYSILFIGLVTLVSTFFFGTD